MVQIIYLQTFYLSGTTKIVANSSFGTVNYETGKVVIKLGDKILEIDGVKIIEFSDISKLISDTTEINILIDRDKKLINKNIKLKFNEQYNKYFLGIIVTVLISPIFKSLIFVDKLRSV